MRTKTYACTECGGKVIFLATGIEDGIVYVIGRCTTCSESFHLELKQLLTDLMEPVMGFDTGGSHETNKAN